MGAAQQARMEALSLRELHERTWQRQSNEPRRECEPSFTLDRQIEAARAEMGEAEWQRLNAEWNTPSEAINQMEQG